MSKLEKILIPSLITAFVLSAIVMYASLKKVSEEVEQKGLKSIFEQVWNGKTN